MSQNTEEQTPVLLRRDDGCVVTLTLNRPAARNALTYAMMAELQDALVAIAADRAVRAVVLAGAGPAFCAGHDMRQLTANADIAYYRRTFAKSAEVMMTILALPQPVIARVHGMATAAGCQLVATCDLAVASTAAQFATPGVHIGLFCSTPMVALSRNLGRKAAMEMLILGDAVPAQRAYELGLVNQVVAPADLDHAIAEMTGKISAKSAATIAIGKEAFYRQLEDRTAEAYAHTAEVMAQNMAGASAREGVAAFLDKRAPVWPE